GRVEVLAPKRASDAQVAAFVAENAAWISQCQEQFLARYGLKDRSLPRSISMPSIDSEVPVRYLRQAKETVSAKGQRALVLSGAIDDEELCRKALKRWLARTAKREFEIRLAALSRETGLQYQRLHVRGQKTCWGSHSSSGTISLNYSLLFVSPEQLRYLLLHELCHGRHMNHSRRFWQLVEQFEPDYKRLDRSMDQARELFPGWLDIF
ncbi:MAG: SprT family zinc-dependent metalloprotease, partial [Pseudomonadota bacterium]